MQFLYVLSSISVLNKIISKFAGTIIIYQKIKIKVQSLNAVNPNKVNLIFRAWLLIRENWSTVCINFAD